MLGHHSLHYIYKVPKERQTGYQNNLRKNTNTRSVSTGGRCIRLNTFNNHSLVNAVRGL